MNPTALTLMLALVVAGVLGAWLLIALLLRTSRDTAVESLVLEHDRQLDTAASELLLLEEIRRVRAGSRERQILVGSCAALVLVTASIAYAVLHLSSALGIL